ncbi:gamma-glutamylcyclotransferase family protein [Shimia biformata]|uniref:gamma-glutamylcyclotransferase family protein n=1 Tax=Shimia biformata TaxID=1294299 RepID=UPI0019501770|nr:gamma-glutamylcyclotransferase family protein [Shimia biformata]
MTRPYFFGYGSLVNRDTHDFPDVRKARLSGWKRVWRHTTWQPRPFLTVERCADAAIDGLIAHVPDGDWAALDQREAGYDRVEVTALVSHDANFAMNIATYTVPEGKHTRPTDDLPIALSYLDVVVEGYLREFGEAGVQGFFATTDGWDAPFVNDRAQPRYSRHRPVSKLAKEMVDDFMSETGAQLAHKKS